MLINKNTRKAYFSPVVHHSYVLFKNLFFNCILMMRLGKRKERSPLKMSPHYFPKIDLEASNKVNCSECRICIVSCPTRCILLKEEKKSVMIDYFNCIHCGFCIWECPDQVILNTEELLLIFRNPEKESSGRL